MIEENMHINPTVEDQSIMPESEEVSGLELFARLVNELSTSTKTNDKLHSLVDYFAPAQDCRWWKDKAVDEINTIEDLKAMLNMYGK